jgi:hypothetical protein
MRRTIYEREGYKDREDYLNVLSQEYNLPIETVRALADKLGVRKEFTELIEAVDDAAHDNLQEKLKKQAE